MSNAYKYQPVANSEQETANRERQPFIVALFSRMWDSSGRQVMTISTTMTISLASIGGLSALAEYGNPPGWLFTVIAMANALGLIGVAVMSWRLFGWHPRRK